MSTCSSRFIWGAYTATTDLFAIRNVSRRTEFNSDLDVLSLDSQQQLRLWAPEEEYGVADPGK